FDTNEASAKGKYADGNGILYPRAGTLGGCTAHNAMITVVPHDSDWNDIAERTGDDSWRADRMWKYFQRVERCLYRDPPKEGESDPSGHGYKGWLGTSRVDPSIGLGDHEVFRTVMSGMWWAVLRFSYPGLFWPIKRLLIAGDDPNDKRNRAAFEGMTTTVPLATACGKRNGTRELIRSVQCMYPDNLTLKLNTLVTRVILDDDNRALGVQCRVG